MDFGLFQTLAAAQIPATPAQGIVPVHLSLEEQIAGLVSGSKVESLACHGTTLKCMKMILGIIC